MVTVSAFRDGFTALRANPILLVAGFLLGAGSQLQYVDSLIESPLLSAGVSLAWLIVFPFVLGGFIEMLEYTQGLYGAHVVQANPSGTTQECTECGVETAKPLSVREHTLPLIRI